MEEPAAPVLLPVALQGSTGRLVLRVLLQTRLVLPAQMEWPTRPTLLQEVALDRMIVPGNATQTTTKMAPPAQHARLQLVLLDSTERLARQDLL